MDFEKIIMGYLGVLLGIIGLVFPIVVALQGYEAWDLSNRTRETITRTTVTCPE